MIRYQLPNGKTKYWNSDWILRVESCTYDDTLHVEIISAIPPGPMTKISAMCVARTFVQFPLSGKEAEMFIEAYDQLTLNSKLAGSD